MELQQKTALVTGASSGIGKSFAYLLAEKGMNLILVARSEAILNNIASDIQRQHDGLSVHVIVQDLSLRGAAKTLHQEVQAQGLKVDLLINNAGFGKWGRFQHFAWDEYEQMMQLNMMSLTELCYLFMEELKHRPSAGILNVGSTASFIPVPYSAVYGATKAYVLSLSEALTGELASSKVHVTCLCPGGTQSNFGAVANAEDRADLSTLQLKSSDEVAKMGIEAFLKGKHYVVTGRKLQIQLFNFFSRRKVIALVGDYWQKLLKIDQ